MSTIDAGITGDRQLDGMRMKKRAAANRAWAKVLLYVGLILISVITVFPFLWMFSLSRFVSAPEEYTFLPLPYAPVW